ncbi:MULTISPECIES: hypothetical protein [Clostridium]|nr:MULTISPECIES: hypothetical protein [Clostridium]
MSHATGKKKKKKTSERRPKVDIIYEEEMKKHKSKGTINPE